MALGETPQERRVLAGSCERRGEGFSTCHRDATLIEIFAIRRRTGWRVPQLAGGLLRSDDMGPDYLDQTKKATVRLVEVIAPEQPAQEDIRRTLREAFTAFEPGDEWDVLLAKIR